MLKVPESFFAKFTTRVVMHKDCTEYVQTHKELAMIGTRTVPSTLTGLSLNCDISSRTGKETLQSRVSTYFP